LTSQKKALKLTIARKNCENEGLISELKNVKEQKAEVEEEYETEKMAL